MSKTAWIVIVLVTSPAFGHELWIEKSGFDYVLQYGHQGGQVLPLERAKLERLVCVDAGGARSDRLGSASVDAKAVKIKGPCASVAAYYHAGFYSVTPDGEVNRPKSQVKDAVKSWESREFVKYVDAAQASVPLGDDLELALVTDLKAARVGEKVTVRAFAGGAPVSGAIVAYDDHPIGQTDSAGEVRLRLRQKGLQLISASLKRPLQTAEADTLVLTANLVFEARP